MRLFIFVVLAVLACVSCHGATGIVDMDQMNESVTEWIEPAFVDSLDSVHEVITPPTTPPAARAWHRTSSNELAPGHHAFAEQSASFQTEVAVESEMSVASQLAATITAEGKTEAELMTEIEVRGPHLWEEFKAYFKRKYTNDLAKYATFAFNLIRIAKLNAQALFSKVPRKLRAVYSHLTPHADLSEVEFKALLTIKHVDPKIVKVAPRAVPRTRITRTSGHVAPHSTFLEMRQVPAPAPDAPLDCDYRAQSTPIKDQGQCGSCYAFACTSILETVWNLRNGQLNTLSPQQLLDCTGGCNGFSPYDALNWWNANGGAVMDALIPYQTKATGSCKLAKDIVTAGSTPIMPKTVEFAIPSKQPQPDEKELGHQLSSSGPIVVMLDATAFQLYKSGVMGSEASCSTDPNKADHAVILEGLGTDAATGQRYWIIRNSWNTWWGETGRIRVAYGANVCGVANWPIKITV